MSTHVVQLYTDDEGAGTRLLGIHGPVTREEAERYAEEVKQLDLRSPYHGPIGAEAVELRGVDLIADAVEEEATVEQRRAIEQTRTRTARLRNPDRG